MVLAGPALNVTFPTQPPASALANIIDDHFIGISYELSSFDTLWGKSVDKQPTAMQNYMHNLVARMSKPLRVRIGGNGMDGSTYVPDLKDVIEHIDEDAYFNDIPVNFGPGFFDILNGMSNKVGPMQFTIGLSMRNGHDFSNVTKLGKAARDKLGSRLDSLFLGNEPDLYAGHGERDAYNISAYIPEIGHAIDALEDAGALQANEKLVGGPTICCSWDLHDILDAGLDQYPYKYYSLQRYPNHACSGQNEKNTNVTYYLTHANVEPYLGWQQQGMLQAQQLNVPVVMSEYNSVACGGSNISSTFAMSLWAVDVGLKAASMNYSAVFLHTREFEIQYNLFDPPSPLTSTEPGWRTGSPYYAALFLSEFTSPGGTVVVDLNLNNSITSPYATVAGYGIYSDSGTRREKLAFINFASEPQVFILPRDFAQKVVYKFLVAPDVLERTNISWAGQTVGNNGDLEGDEQLIQMNCENGCRVTVPGPGAVLIALANEALYTGNSTIVGIGSYLSGATVPYSCLPGLLFVFAALVTLLY
ncbi:glycoside hydrolase family 79 protein [Hebeloma cylindrosporum]|uniref:Glycoside hydrolase family 79 protein n=1 Tax=Hebeloma cylindrosporum TaxID=76867 RepID=A0A0C3C0W1_HEBCY|nr:glycoside hydrolase family 79 protein [Hebeloma cylindrosporum h7]